MNEPHIKEKHFRCTVFSMKAVILSAKIQIFCIELVIWCTMIYKDKMYGIQKRTVFNRQLKK
jgi:hypothetical protein